MTLTANKLERKIAQDTGSSFEAIFNEHWPRVYGVIFRLVGEGAEAEDLALDTFWRLHRRPPGDLSNLGGWLYRVATNLGLNALRARKRRVRYEEEAGKMRLDYGTASDPAVEVERSEERRRVRQVLAKLKPRSAKLLVLRYSGLSYEEIAATLGLSPSSVGTMLVRAEREFEKRYQQEGTAHVSD